MFDYMVLLYAFIVLTILSGLCSAIRICCGKEKRRGRVVGVRVVEVITVQPAPTPETTPYVIQNPNYRPPWSTPQQMPGPNRVDPTDPTENQPTTMTYHYVQEPAAAPYGFQPPPPYNRATAPYPSSEVYHPQQ
ncbi:uncharacterized protein LOC124162642 [Ischnura elegans]|uniref:uncharacterized protein LOC124162642 n=1 Tax=Ischnura elegans TaxID=197161 RepID=UPI001ED86CEC|nr:uncharacterized protein LOC124162642 [Ischnura elegans]